MKCTDFENRLNELLDDRLSPQEDAALVGHAENCVDCREMLAAQESLFRGMAQLKRRSVAVGGSLELGTRVLSELNVSVTTVSLPPAVRKPFRWLPLIAAAAAVLVAVSVGMWIVARNNQQPTLVQPGQNEKDRNPGFALVKPGGTRGQQAAPKSVQPESIAVTPPSKVEPRFVPVPAPTQPRSSQPDIDLAMATLASHWRSSGQWVQVETINVEHYAPGIRPIRESFEVAIDALLKTIPQGNKESRPAPPQALQPSGDVLDIA